jgi:hypothetical protein
VCTTRLATVVVHVRHPRFRVDVPGDVVRVQRGRQAGADVNELPDTAGCHMSTQMTVAVAAAAGFLAIAAFQAALALGAPVGRAPCEKLKD